MRLGARASAEMQLEARRVQLENRLLRRMLLEQGVSEQEIYQNVQAESQRGVLDSMVTPLVQYLAFTCFSLSRNKF